MQRLIINLLANAAAGVIDAQRQLEAQNEKEIELVERIRENRQLGIEAYCYGKRLDEILMKGTALKAPETLEEELALTYEQYVVYLLNKYGSAKFNYFKKEYQGFSVIQLPRGIENKQMPTIAVGICLYKKNKFSTYR